jgi:ubiquinone/menaquinone biosynthesis C-methylase UbiE
MHAPDALAPNHHAHYGGFHGIGGLLTGLLFLVGRGPAAEFAVTRTGVGAGDRVVDIGCGPGSAIRKAVRRGATATGVDPAPVMLKLARLTARRGQARWLDGTAESVPVPDDDATVVWSLATVHHWRDIDRGLAEVVRVLRPGGRFLVIERHARPGATGLGSHGWTPDQAQVFAQRCEEAGLTSVQVSEHMIGRTKSLVVDATLGV